MESGLVFSTMALSLEEDRSLQRRQFEALKGLHPKDLTLLPACNAGSILVFLYALAAYVHCVNS